MSGRMEKSDAWCIFVTFEGTNLQKLKVPINPADSCRQLLLKVVYALLFAKCTSGLNEG